MLCAISINTVSVQPQRATLKLDADTAACLDCVRPPGQLMECMMLAGLKRNPEMVYALLHRQEVFQPFRMHVRFSDILDNIQVCQPWHRGSSDMEECGVTGRSPAGLKPDLGQT